MEEGTSEGEQSDETQDSVSPSTQSHKESRISYGTVTNRERSISSVYTPFLDSDLDLLASFLEPALLVGVTANPSFWSQPTLTYQGGLF